MKSRALSRPDMIRSSSASGVGQILPVDGPQSVCVQCLTPSVCGTRRGFVALLLSYAGGRVCCGGHCPLPEAGTRQFSMECEMKIGRIGGDRVENVIS